MPSLEKYDRSLDYTYAPGIFPSMEALTKAPERVRRLLLDENAAGEGIDDLLRLCDAKRVRVEVASKVLRRVSGKDNCFAAAVTGKVFSPLTGARHVVLHHIMDRGNLGTILRTALAFGYEDVGIIRPAADVYDPHVVRASMGAVFSLRVREYDSFEEYMQKERPGGMYPFMLTGSCPAEEAAAARPERFSLIFGNEGSGLPEAFSKIGTPVRIRQTDRVDSLNLAVAAAVGMYTFRPEGF